MKIYRVSMGVELKRNTLLVFWFGSNPSKYFICFVAKDLCKDNNFSGRHGSKSIGNNISKADIDISIAEFVLS